MGSLDASAFIGKFVEEARDRLKGLTDALLRVEQTREPAEAIAEVLRQAHTLKGSARMLGLNDISQLAHALEDLFVMAKRDHRLLDARAFDLVFGALDVLSLRVEQLARGMLEPVEVAGLCQKLASIAMPATPAAERADADGAPAGASVAPVETPAASAAGPGVAPGLPSLRQSLRVPIEKLDGLANLAAEMVLQSLKASERHAELRRLEATLRDLKDRAREARLTPATPFGGAQGAQLREYADALEQVSRRLRQFVEDFSDDRVRLNLITEELRQTVIELTMLPLATVFSAFPPRGARSGAHVPQRDRPDDPRR